MAKLGRALVASKAQIRGGRRSSAGSSLVGSRLVDSRLVVVALAALLNVSCSQVVEMHRQEPPGIYTEDGTSEVQASAQSRRQVENAAAEARQADRDAGEQAKEMEAASISRGPELRPLKTVAVTEGSQFVPDLQGEPVGGSYNNVPLPAFIDLVFGEQLGLAYSLDGAVANQEDLVNLRLQKPVPPADLFAIARRTLMDYGVAMRYEQDVYTFYVDRNITAASVPIMVTGRALPEVPESHRPLFVFVPLEAVKPDKVRNWLRSAMRGQELEILEDPLRNSVILRGKPAVIEQAMAMVGILDQPNMRGKFSISIEPAYAEVKTLADDLEGILTSEGYDISQRPPIGAIMLLPLKSSNQLVAFAPTREVLDHIEDWVKVIDRRQQLAVEDGIFSYEVNSTQASYIVDLLNQLSAVPEEGLTRERRGADEGEASTDRSSREAGQFVVDSNRNAIIFRGSGKQWSDLLPVIQEMDQLAPSVLVEVLLADISLTDTDSSSFQFLRETMVGDYDLSFGTLDNLGGRPIFSATLDKAGDVRAILRLLYENRRAEIRSRPRLMVKSGQTASIDVGDEIPVLTTASQSTQNPDAPIVQNIVYRTTGVRLQIRPTVHNSGFVDIDVSQELSEAFVTGTSGIDSPTIRNRTLQTTVTLRDGGSILLGGLITSTKTDDETGVPFLGALPGVGSLFRSDSKNEDRRELLVMIIPYVMEEPGDAEALTEQLTDVFLTSSSANPNSP